MIVAIILYVLGIAQTTLFMLEEEPNWSPAQFLGFGAIWPLTGAAALIYFMGSCIYSLFEGKND